MKTILSLILAFASAFVPPPRAGGEKPPARSAVPPGPVFPLVEDGRIAFDGEITGRPAALGDVVVFATVPDAVQAASFAAKKILWRFTAKAAVAGPPLAGDDFIVVFDRGGRMTKLSKDGKALWDRAIPGEISAPPVLAAGSILAVFGGRTVRRFDPASGAETWSWTAEDGLRTAPRAWGQRLVLLTASKKAVILDPSGKASPGFETPAAASGPILISGDVLIAGFDGGTLEAWSLTKKKRLWTVKIGSPLAADPVEAGPRIYFSAESRQLFAVRTKRGDVDWWRGLPGRPVGEVAVWGKRLVAASLSPVLSAFEAATGEAEKPTDLKWDAVSPPLVLGDRIVLAVRDPVSLKEALVSLKGQPPPAPVPKKKEPQGAQP